MKGFHLGWILTGECFNVLRGSLEIQMPTWLRYSLALVLVVLVGTISEIPDFALPSPQDSSWSPLIGLAHAVVVGVAFSLLLVSVTILFNRPQNNLRQSTLRGGAFVFLLFAGGDFVVELLSRPFFSGLSGHAELQNALAHLVRAGGGWLLPLMFLAAFIAVILLKHRRA
jgi:hypothetical protein